MRARAGALGALLLAGCEPPADLPAPSVLATSTVAATLEAPPGPDAGAAPAPGPSVRVRLESDLTPLEVRAFRRRARLRLPRYKRSIERSAERHGFDWRLVVAVAYVESQFNPLAKSRTGVRGFMQLTRNTAEAMDVDNRLDAHQSIRGGVRYLDRLHGRFDAIREFHRTLFAMASYNVGYGHVRDAQRLAKRQALDPRVWQTLEEVLPLLSDPEYAALTRYGRARGWEPVRYVRKICNYFVLQKRDHCRRRAALGELVLGERPPSAPIAVPARVAAAAKDGVVPLTWSHPYICAVDDCDLMARLEATPEGYVER